MPDDFNPTEWITTTEAAALMGYDYAHVRLLLRRGRLQGMKLGRDWLIRRESALTYAREMRELGTAKHNPWKGRAR